MMEPNYPFWINENITAPLTHVPLRFLWKTTMREFLEICPPCVRSPDIPIGGFEHVIGFVNVTGSIYKKRPMKAGILDISFGEKTRFKGHDHHFHISPVKLIFVLLQLQQVPTARESPEVSVKDHQEPRPPIIVEKVGFPFRVRKNKWESRLPNQASHEDLSLSGVSS
jgi:hypothetical protein